jgi:hypothetical protein
MTDMFGISAIATELKCSGFVNIICEPKLGNLKPESISVKGNTPLR